MTDNPVERTENLPNPDSRAPTFGIRHLLTVTAATAVYFAWMERVDAIRFAGQESNVVETIISSIYSISAGLSLAGIIWLITLRRNTGRMIHHPGHWILLIYGSTLAGYMLTSLLLLSLWMGDADADGLLENNWIIPICWSLISFFEAGLLAFAIFRCCQQKRWQAYLTVWCIVSLYRAVDLLTIAFDFLQAPWWTFDDWIYVLSTTVQSGVLIVAIVADRILQTTRDWIHWCGIVAALMMVSVAPILDFIYFRFFWQMPET